MVENLDPKLYDPFAQGGLDEALGLAVRTRRVGPGVDELEAEPAAEVAEASGAVARAVVGHDAFDGDAEAGVVGDGGPEEGGRAGLALAGHDPAEGDAGGVVDGDMDELPAGAAVAVAVPPAGDAMAGPVELPELLDVDVDQLAGLVALVAPGWLGRLQRGQYVSQRRVDLGQLAQRVERGVIVTVFPDGAEKYLSESFWTADE